MIVTSLAGETEILTDYTIKERKRVVNGEYSLPFFLTKTARNAHSFDLVQEESIIEYENQEYRVKRINNYMQGKTLVKDVQTCQHVFFDIIDDYQYETLNGTLNMVQALTHVFSVTGWSWINQGAFELVRFENFGDGNALELFKQLLERYGAEFDITGPRQVTIKNQIGIETDEIFRYKYNIKTINKFVNTDNLSTFIKGFGKDGLVAEYTSPNASIYNIRHAPAFRDEKFTIQANLEAHLQKILNDEPEIAIELELTQLGINCGLGDTLILIHEELGIEDSTARILEYTDYPETKRPPKVVLANFKHSFTNALVSFQQTAKTLKKLTDVEGNISLGVKRLYRNTNHYSDHTGDWYVSPDDPNAYVHTGAGGIDIHKGLLRVEREDGYAVIVGGIIQHGLAIQGSIPTFKTAGVVEVGQFYRTNSQDPLENIQRFVFKHDSRYVRIIANMYCDGGVEFGNVGRISFSVFDDYETVLITSAVVSETRHSTAQGYRKDILLDVGVPTGELLVIYWRMWSSTTYHTYGSVRYLEKEG